MKGEHVIFSKKGDDWSTPKDLYAKLDEEFNFNFDPCPLYPEEDGLEIEWHGNVFCNPPYSNATAFIKKGTEELEKGNCNLVVFLIFARTDTRWFHNYFYEKQGVEIRFIKGRLKFGESKNSAPAPSMLAICRN